MTKSLVQDFMKVKLMKRLWVSGYITGEKQNIYTYGHDFMVQKVLSQIVGGIQIHSKHIDER